jgi:WD40 repeat protein
MPGGTILPCDLFVCYAEPDRGWAEHYLVEGLRAAGVRCSTAAAFRPGASQVAEFERAVAESPRVLLVLSAAARADVDQRFLDDLARYHELESQTESVIPLLLDDGPAPLGVRAKVSLRATTDEEKAEAVKRLVSLCRSGPASAAPAPRCPYPGLAPFERGDAARFHGRRREVDELLQVLEHRNCLFLIGRSGSGKSSLVLAGLLPRLEEGRTVRVMRPGAAPRGTLEALDWGGASRPLLVVDQFEELYTQAPPEEAAAFQRALCDWVADPARVLLVTVRADFYADLQASAIFPLFQANHSDVLPPGREALREAIIKPAAAAGVFVEPALGERLLADAAGEPGVLPLLQETMRWLWGKLRRRYLPVEAYDELGRDGRTGLQQAMAVIADAAVDGLPPAEQALARRTLVRLVQFGEGRQDTRRRQPLADLESAGDPPGVLDHVVGRLIVRRLIVAGSVRTGAGETTAFDLAHEALITGWPRLRDWVREGREAEQVRRRLEEHAAEWVRLGRGGGGLIDEVRLPAAEQWLARHAGEVGASAELRALVAASRAKIDADRAVARRRRLATVLSLAAGLVIVTGLAVWGFSAADDARREAHVASASLTDSAWEVGHVDGARDWLAAQIDVRFPWQRDLRGFEWYYWWRGCHRARRTLRGHDYEVGAVAFADGDALVSVTGEKNQPVQVIRWNGRGEVEWKRNLPEPTKGETFLRAVALSRDGRRLAMAVGTKKTASVTVWEVGRETADPSPFEEALNGTVTCLGFSPDGTLVAAGSHEGDFAVWDVAGRRLLYRSPGGPKEVYALAFDDRGRLAVAGEDKAGSWVKCFQAVTGKELPPPADLPFAGRSDVFFSAVAFSDDEQVLAAGNVDGEVWVQHSNPRGASSVVLHDVPYGVPILRLAFAPGDTPLLAGVADDHTVRLWDAETGALRDDSLKHPLPVSSLAFSRDGKTLASGCIDRQVRLWDVPQDDVRETPSGQAHGDRVFALASSPDGRLLASAGGSVVLLWDVRTGRVIRRIEGHEGYVHAAAYSPDGSRLATAGEDGRIRFWKAATGAHEDPDSDVRMEGKEWYALAFALDGTLAAATRDGTVMLFRPGEQTPLHEERKHEKAVYQLAWSPDGAILASAGGDGKVLLWDRTLRLRAKQPRVPESAQEAWTVAFSAPGQRLELAAGFSDQHVRLWDPETDAPRRDFGCGDGRVHGVAFSPDGSTLAAAGQSVHLWSLRTGRRHATLRLASKEPTTAVAFTNPDRDSGGMSRVLVAGGNNGTVRFWRAATEAEVRAREE